MLVERAVGPVQVVVLDVVDHEPVKSLLVPDESAVEQLTADRPDPALVKPLPGGETQLPEPAWKALLR